jgi:RpiR family transcriptional regulator, carbohydrate utilization regulator
MLIHSNLIDRIRQSVEDLNKAERRVANTMLKDIDGATRMTIKDLAQSASVSEPTIVRFARRMGCEGFSDFKIRLSQDHAIARMFVLNEDEELPRDAALVANHVYEAAAQALAQSFARCDAAALDHAAEAIVGARRVCCLGVGGSSANVAAEAENRLFRYDIAASFTADPYRQRMVAALSELTDVLLIFSVTGKPRSLVESASTARALGATVIAVTRPKTPLAKESSILVPLEILDHEKHLQIPSRTRYGQFFMLDCIATLVGTRRLHASAEKLRRVRAAITAVHGPTDQQPLGD